MVSAFIEAECYHYVEPPAVLNAATVIVEEEFNDAVPDETGMVANEITRQKKRVTDSFGEMMDVYLNVADAGHITVEVANIERIKLNNQKLQELFKIDNSEVMLLDKYLSAMKDWRFRKEQHVKMVGKCMNVFNSCLGESAKSVIKDHLNQQHFRAAWIALDRHYHLGIGGQQNIAEIVHQLTSMVYNPSIPLQQHIQNMTDMTAEMNAVTHHVDNPNLTLEWVLLSIEKSSCRDFDKDIDDIRRSEKTLEQSIQLFQKTESRLMVHNGKSNSQDNSDSKHQRGSGGDSANVVQQQQRNQSGAGGKTCKICQRIGHLAKDCWKNLTCGHCGKKGHPTDRCRDKQDGTGKSEDSGNSNNKNNSKNVPLVKLFENKSVNFKQNANYFVSFLDSIESALEYKDQLSNDSEKMDIVDPTVHNCNCVTDGLERPDVTLSTFAEFESLLQSDLTTNQISIFKTDANIPGICRTLGIILDSGATNHMFADKTLFKTLTMFTVDERVPKKEADGKMIWASGIGNSNLDELSPALYVPFLSVSLISVSKMKDCDTLFNNDVATVYNKNGHIILQASILNNLYWLDNVYVSLMTNDDNEEDYAYNSTQKSDVLPCNHNAKSDKILSHNSNDAFEVACNVALQELHEKFGHLSEYNLKRILRENLVLGIEVSYDEVKNAKLDKCIACYKGKMKAFPSVKDNPVKNRDLMEKIGIDYKGPFRIRSVHKFNGFTLFHDYASGFMYVQLMRDKRNSLNLLKKFNNEVVLPLEKKNQDHSD